MASDGQAEIEVAPPAARAAFERGRQAVARTPVFRVERSVHIVRYPDEHYVLRQMTFGDQDQAISFVNSTVDAVYLGKTPMTSLFLV